MTSRRDSALAAAVRLIGDHGIRALSHARVDDSAGLPRGSTSNWFRTRQALIDGAIGWIAERERAELEAVATRPIQSIDEALDALSQLLDTVTRRDGTRTRARYALLLESSVAAGVTASTREQRAAFATWMRDLLATLGSPDPDTAARAVLAVSAGLIVNRLTVDPDAEVRGPLELTLRAGLAPQRA